MKPLTALLKRHSLIAGLALMFLITWPLDLANSHGEPHPGRVMGILASAQIPVVVGLVLLRREGHPLTLTGLRERIRLQWPKGWQAWGVAALVLVGAIALSQLLGPVNKALAGVPGFVPPSWWPPISNPTLQVKSAADVFPDVNLKGNFLFLAVFFVIALVGNIFGEEIYYRGYLLPRMHGVFGRWDWVANGVLFTLKHVYQRWLYPGILVGGLSFAFAFGPLGSLPLAMTFHWLGNFFLPMILLALAVFGRA